MLEKFYFSLVSLKKGFKNANWKIIENVIYIDLFGENQISTS